MESGRTRRSTRGKAHPVCLFVRDGMIYLVAKVTAQLVGLAAPGITDLVHSTISLPDHYAALTITGKESVTDEVGVI